MFSVDRHQNLQNRSVCGSVYLSIGVAGNAVDSRFQDVMAGVNNGTSTTVHGSHTQTSILGVYSVHLQSTSRVEPATARADTNWSMMPHGTFMKLWSDHWHLNTA